MKVGLIAGEGIFVASPIVLYQLWLVYLARGSFANEKRYSNFRSCPQPCAVVFWQGGGFRLFHVSTQPRWKFLIEVLGYPGFGPLITVTDSTPTSFSTIMLGLGIVFEMPIVIFFLALMGIVDAGLALAATCVIRYLIIFIIAAIVTPHDPTS